MSIDVYLRVVLGIGVVTAKRRQAVIVASAVAILIPFLSMICAYMLDDDDHVKKIHLARQNFTCEPRLETVLEEWLIIHIHFIIGAAGSAGPFTF